MKQGMDFKFELVWRNGRAKSHTQPGKMQLAWLDGGLRE